MARPFIPAANTASVEMIYIWSGVTCENVFHVHKGSPYSLADLQALRALVITWWNVSARASTTPACVLTRIRTKSLDTNIGPMEDFSLSPAQPGTYPGASVPNGTTLCMKLSSGLTGRSARGRWYIVGLPTDAMVNSVDTSSGFAGGWVTRLDDLRARLLAAGHTLVITSYRNSGAWRAAAVNYTVVSTSYTDLHFDSQRRRLAGRGA